MRNGMFWTLAVVSIFALAVPTAAFAQRDRDSRRNRPPDEFREILEEIEDSYEAVAEFRENVAEDLARLFREPRPDREERILRRVRQVYHTTPELEAAIVRDVRAAYEHPSAQAVDRIFYQIGKAKPIDLGMAPPHILVDEASKLFRKLDMNRDNVLVDEEMSEVLYRERGKWDRDRNGALTFDEYGQYYQVQWKWVAERVASGQIQAKLPRIFQKPPPRPMISSPPAAKEQRTDVAAEKEEAPLPEWFMAFDSDGDGQVGLYEWNKRGESIKDFLAMDKNTDGFLVADELRDFLAKQAKTDSGG